MESLLEQYNPQWKKKTAYDHLIPRINYSERLMQLIDRREIIVLQGIRRSGKSSLLKLLMKALMDRGTPKTNLFFMNLEDYRFGSDKNLETLDQVYQAYINKIDPEGRFYIFLDEIQEIPDFERWLRTYYEQNEQIKFVVTGSSSSLFSAELATLLTGRQIALEVFPFSFPEYLQLHDKKLLKRLAKPIDSIYLSPAAKKVDPLLQTYLSNGGFPEVVKHDEPEANMLLLQQYIGDIILRDIARRYNIRKIEVLQKLALFLIFNMGGAINISRISQIIGSNRTTVLELIAYLKEVYMVFTTTSFSFSASEQLNTTKPKKIYCIDNGFYAAINTSSNKDFAKRFRNAVFQQLRFHWQDEIFYWRGKVEIDFVLKDGFPIAVLSDEKEKNNEVYKLFHYMSSHNISNGLLINWSKLQIVAENEHKVLLLPLWLFLTKSKKEVMAYYGDD